MLFGVAIIVVNVLSPRSMAAKLLLGGVDMAKRSHHMKIEYLVQFKYFTDDDWITLSYTDLETFRRAYRKLLDRGCKIRLFEKSVYLKSIES